MSRPVERAQPVWCLLYKHEELSLEPWCSHKSQLLLKKTEEKHKALCRPSTVSADSMTARRKVASGWGSLWEAGALKGPTELEVGMEELIRPRMGV